MVCLAFPEFPVERRRRSDCVLYKEGIKAMFAKVKRIVKVKRRVSKEWTAKTEQETASGFPTGVGPVVAGGRGRREGGREVESERGLEW